MADTTEQLVFKLVIDDKEVPVKLDAAKGEFLETGAAAEKAADKISEVTFLTEEELQKQEKAYDELKEKTRQSFSEMGDAGEDYVANLGGNFDGVNVTAKDLLERLEDLKVNLQNAPIGGEEYQRWAEEIKNVNAQLEKVKTTLETTNETPAFQNLTAEALKYGEITKENTSQLAEYIAAQGLSSETIQGVIQSLDAEIKTLAINSDAWRQKIVASTNLKAAYGQLITQNAALNSSAQALAPTQQNLRFTFSQLGSMIGNADNFMGNFRSGMNMTAHMLPELVQALNQARITAASTGTTISSQLTAALMGGGGLILGMQALMLLLQLMPGLFEDTTKSIEEQKEAVEKLKDEYAKLTREQLNNYIQAREEQVRQLEAKYPQTTKILPGLQFGEAGQRVELKPEERFGDDADSFQRLQNELDALKETARDLGVIENVRNRITINQQQLNKLNEDETSPFYWKNIVKTARSYEEAKKTLDQWIAADQKLVDLKKSRALKDKTFDNMMAEIEAAQQHQIAMAEIEGKGEAVILEMKRQHLVEMIGHYETYNKDVKNLLYELVETEAALQKSIKPPEIPIGTPEDIELGNVRDEDEFNKFMARYAETRDAELNAEEELTLKRAELFGASEEQKLAIQKYYSNQRKQLEGQVLMSQLSQTANMLGQLAGLFGQHTAAYKTLAIAQTWIETYKAVAALYAPPPTGVGPVLAPFMTAAVIGMGAMQTAKIASQPTEMKGYATGGRLPAGRAGIIEGTHNELIAPEEDFKTVIKDISGESIRRALVDLRLSGGTSSSSSVSSSAALLNEIKILNRNFERYAENPVAPVITKDAVGKIYRDGSAKSRRSKL